MHSSVNNSRHRVKEKHYNLSYLSFQHNYVNLPFMVALHIERALCEFHTTKQQKTLHIILHFTPKQVEYNNNT